MTAIDKKFLSGIGDLPGKWAFRGQENSNWGLYSSAVRRLKIHPVDLTKNANSDFPDIHLNYHLDELIAPARTAGFGIEEARQLTDLQLLAKLRHFGAATGLLDFTWNPLVALWFACNVPRESGTADSTETDGKVFLVNLNDPQGFRLISHETEDQAIERVFLTQGNDRPSYWEPMVRSEVSARIIAQRSVFVIGRPFIPDRLVEEKIVYSSDKPLFRKELAEVYGITEESLFRDVYGFSAINRTDSPIRLMKNPQYHRYRGNELYQEERYSDAINSYDKAIDQCPEVRELYCLRADAKSNEEDYAGALADYKAAEQCEQDFIGIAPAKGARDRELAMRLFFNRGNVRAALSEHCSAVADYSKAIKFCPTEFRHISVAFNRANSYTMLQKLKKALADYDYIIDNGMDEPRSPYKDAHFNKGNTLVILGRFEESVPYYRDSLRAGHDNSGAHQNLEAANKVLKYLAAAGRVEQIARVPEPSARQPVERVKIICSGIAQDFDPIPFRGNVGSKGNRGGRGLSGGPGFGGQSGFDVQICKS